MKSHEAIELLRGFQSQIIHGNNTFGDIADVIVHLEKVCGELQSVPKVPEGAVTAETPPAWLAEYLRERINEAREEGSRARRLKLTMIADVEAGRCLALVELLEEVARRRNAMSPIEPSAKSPNEKLSHAAESERGNGDKTL